jgi:glutathione peroxidase
LYETHQKDGLEILAFPCNQFGNQEPGKMNSLILFLIMLPINFVFIYCMKIQFHLSFLGTNEEIKEFATSKFGATFPIFSKIDVKGENGHPLFIYLQEVVSGGFLGSTIKWNFEKFLIDRKGTL